MIAFSLPKTWAFAAGRRVLLAVLLAVAALVAVLPPDADAADPCPNAEFRTGASARLPDCRAYELVSPPDKGGLPVYAASAGGALGIIAAANDGNAAIFTSWGVFAGSPTGLPASYRSVRGESGWVTEAVSRAPATRDPQAVANDGYRVVWEMVSRNLDSGAMLSRDGFDPTDLNDQSDAYAATPGSAALAARGDADERTGADGSSLLGLSGDGSHVVFSARDHLVAEDAERAASQDVYDRTGGRTHLVNQVDGGGAPINRCGSQLGSVVTRRNSISSDGRRIIFQVPNAMGAQGDADHPDCHEKDEIYMRVDHERTIHISASQRSTPPPNVDHKVYAGASEDGDRIFFKTSEPLTDDASPDGGLYRYTVSSGELELVSDAWDLAVWKISADGSRVYFKSGFQLAPGAVLGESNLYVYDRGTIKLVGTGPPGLFGLDPRDPEQFRPAVVTPDGRYLLFAVYPQLTAFENVDATGALRRAMYLYDAVEDEVICLSCDPAGQRPAGAEVRSDAELTSLVRFDSRMPYYPDDQAPQMSADGQTVVFESGDRLVPEDTNLQRDVYVWKGGRLSLVSSGRSSSESLFVGMGANGRDVFFTTAESLVAADADGGNTDVYTARIGGGVPYEAPAVVVPCGGDACQGEASSQPRWVGPGSGKLAAPWSDAIDRGAGAALKVAGARTVRGASAILRVRVPRSGRIRVSGAGLAGVSRSAGRAGSYRLTLRLSKASRRTLRAGRLVRVRANVRFTARSGGGSRASLAVTFKPKRAGASRRATDRSMSKGSR